MFDTILRLRLRRNTPYYVNFFGANLRTGLNLRTNTSTHFTWSSPQFIPVVLISGLVFAKTHSPLLALKRLSYVIAWNTTNIYQQFNSYTAISNSSHSFLIVDISNLCVMCGSADLHDNWTACMRACYRYYSRQLELIISAVAVCHELYIPIIYIYNRISYNYSRKPCSIMQWTIPVAVGQFTGLHGGWLYIHMVCITIRIYRCLLACL